MKPIVLNKEDITEKDIQNEKEILRSQAESDGKEGEILEKIIEGKMKSFYKDNVVLEQVFCNPDFYEGTVGNMIGEFAGRLGEKIYIKQFYRLEIGNQ